MSEQPAVPPTGPPPPSASKSSIALVIGAALLVIALVTAVVFIAQSDSDTGTIRIARPATSDDEDDDGGRGDSGEVLPPEVIGDPLPSWDEIDDAFDPALGQTIPTIVGTDYAGETVTIQPGEPLIIVAMAHWCPHCQAEIPRIVEWADQGLADDVEVIGVSTAVDEAKGNFPPDEWLADEDWPYEVLADDDEATAGSALGVTGFPTFIAVTADGWVAQRMTGEIEEDQFVELVDMALGAFGDPGTESDDDILVPSTIPDPGDPADCPAADGSSEERKQFPEAPPFCIDPSKTYTALVDTTLGAFTITLDPTIAPETVNNFVFLARYHYYDGIVFHRIIPGFMFQGGDPEGTGSGGPGYEFADELPADGDYEMYSVAMANAGPDTNGSQFFVITGADGIGLPPSYSLFGKVTAGTDVADAIGSVLTGDQDRPISDVVMNTVTITES